MSWNTDKSANEIEQLKTALAEADSVVVGAGAGLSTSAGFTYSGSRFEKYFRDFAAKYGFNDMYSGGFYPYNSLEQYSGAEISISTGIRRHRSLHMRSC